MRGRDLLHPTVHEELPADPVRVVHRRVQREPGITRHLADLRAPGAEPDEEEPSATTLDWMHSGEPSGRSVAWKHTVP